MGVIKEMEFDYFSRKRGGIMTVNNVGSNQNNTTNTFQLRKITGEDSVSMNIQNQIQNAQEQLQSIGENKELSPDEKMKRRQEIQKQISDLQNQLRQHQIEQQRENRQKKSSGSSMEDMLGAKQSSKAGKKNGAISKASMQAIITAGSTLNQIEVQGALKGQMDGQAGVLETEIKLDSARGANVERKEEELASIEDKANKIQSSQMEMLAEANKEIKDTQDTEDKKQEVKDNDKKNSQESEAVPDGVEVNPDNPVGNNVDEII